MIAFVDLLQFYYIQKEDLGGPVKAGESYWMLSDGEININLQKMNKAEVWSCALLGHHGETVDELTREEQKKKIMLERFQDEVVLHSV